MSTAAVSAATQSLQSVVTAAASTVGNVVTTAAATVAAVTTAMNASTESFSRAASTAAADAAGFNATTFLSDYEALKENADTFFIIMNGILIFMMQAGFALLEAGSIRSHNTTNILLTNCMDAFVCCLAYWAVGFSFAFGEGGNFIGSTYWFGTFPEKLYAKWFFNYVFAAATPTIVSGALAERCDFYAYLLYSVVLTGFIYPVVSRWAWYTSADGSVVGWLADGKTVVKDLSFQDFAGSGVVHLCGGTAAMVAVVFLGPRTGRFNERGKAVNIPGHSIPLTTLGGILLMFGFFAFNGGSQVSITKAGDGAAVARAVVNTIICGSSAGITAMLFKRIVYIVKKWGCYCNRDEDDVEPPWSIVTLVNGALTGMVAVCSGCNVMDSWGAFITGFFVALIYSLISWAVVKLKIDDPVDALAVHFGGGLGGLLATPFVDAKKGILVTRSIQSGLQLGVQVAGALAIVAWTGTICILLFVVLKFTGLLRVDTEVEMKGLDGPKHHEPAYPAEAYLDSWQDSVKEAIIKQASLSQLRLDNGELKSSASTSSMLSSTHNGNGSSSVVFTTDDGSGAHLRHFAKTS